MTGGSTMRIWFGALALAFAAFAAGMATAQPAAKKGFVKVRPGEMVCSDGVIGRGFVIASEPGKDQRQLVDIYDRKDHDHKAKRLKAAVPVYVTRSDGARGLELIYEDPEAGVVSYKVFECKLKLK